MVIQKLGYPNRRFAPGEQVGDRFMQAIPLLGLLVKPSPETWVYGPTFRFRDLGPADDDVVIEFNDNGTVVQIVIPHGP
jgi:hypothetical protein